MKQILKYGYCVITDVLDSNMIDQLIHANEEMIAQQDEDHFKDKASQGCIINITTHPFMAKLIAYPKVIKIFIEFGFDDPKFLSGYVISKPPGGPPKMAPRLFLVEPSY